MIAFNTTFSTSVKICTKNSLLNQKSKIVNLC